jgi:DNA replication and repair protein RecF
MGIIKLNIKAVRNIDEQSILPAPGFNLIYGVNASGKSSLIEAIYILGRGKSFRTSNLKSVINFNYQQLFISGLITQDFGNPCHVGLSVDSKSIMFRINHQSSNKRSDLAYKIPLQLIYPKSYELLDSGSQNRREFMDWGIFHENENFLFTWRKFKKALLQRNVLLKTKQLDYVKVWDKELSYYGTIVDACRMQYINNIKPVFINIARFFLDDTTFNIKFSSGWDTSIPYERVLINELTNDIRLGYTSKGPHRADFILTFNNRLARDYVSRGQLKLLVICLKLAQVQLLSNKNNKLACLLIDDFANELDFDNCTRLINYIDFLKCQAFISSTDINDFGNIQKLSNFKLFHVEQGNIRSV